jgi:hypothetical protein
MKRSIQVVIAALAIICLALSVYLQSSAPKPSPATIGAEAFPSLAPTPAVTASSIGPDESLETKMILTLPQSTPSPKPPPLSRDKVTRATKAYLKYTEMERVSRSDIKAFEAKTEEITPVIEAEVSAAMDVRHPIALLEALHDPDSAAIFTDLLHDPSSLDVFRRTFQPAGDQLDLGLQFSQITSPEQLLALATQSEGNFRQHYEDLSKKLALGDNLENSASQLAAGKFCSDMLKEYMSAHGYRFNDNTKQFVEIQ